MNTDATRSAIATKFLGPSNHGNRIAVWRADGNYRDDPDAVRVDWNDRLDLRENHAAAVDAYLDRKAERGNDWREGGRWMIGSTDTGVVAVWVRTD